MELAGTAVSSVGAGGTSDIATVTGQAAANIALSPMLQWQEGYYRGYFLLTLTPEQALAQFYGSPSVATRNSWDLPLANFTMAAGANHIMRPIGGGSVEAGVARGGETKPTNLTLNTDFGKWEVVGFEMMFLYVKTLMLRVLRMD